MQLLESLSWRYAAKSFDNSKKVAPNQIEFLKKAIQLSCSSFGLQLYKVLIIKEDSLKKKLMEVSYGQKQIYESSHLFVFCTYKELLEKHIDDYLELKSIKEEIPVANLEKYGSFIKNSVLSKELSIQEHWMAKQVYIAMSHLLIACAELKIDSCPIEGFEPYKYDEILNLSDKNLVASVVVPIGYRLKEDDQAHLKKIRKPFESIFEEL